MTDNERVLRMLGWTRFETDKAFGRRDISWFQPNGEVWEYGAPPDPRDHPGTVLEALKWMGANTWWMYMGHSFQWEDLGNVDQLIQATGDTYEDGAINGLVAWCNENGWPDTKWQGD